MAAPLAIKDVARERALFRRRADEALVGVAILVLIIIGRAVKLQIIDHAHFTTLSHDNYVKIVAVPPTRGLIYDRNGVVLAENLPSFSLEITPEQVRDIDATIDALSKVIRITASDRQEFIRLQRKQRRFDSLPIRINLNDEELAAFAVNRYRFPGVDIAARLHRSYPYGALAVHVLGYVGRINEAELLKLDASNYSATSHIGKTGIEQAYESILHGRVGYQQVETNAQGRVLRVLERTDPVPGHDLRLNIDIKLQEVAAQAMQDNSGAVVAIDPRDGALLAMLSLPGFDPNPFVSGIDRSSYRALQKSATRPLFNRALQGQYPPGSTVKPFLGLAGLEFGLREPGQASWCRGWYQISEGGRKYRDWKKTGHGHVGLGLAITESCDVYFYELASDLGIDRMHEFMTRFGFGSKTGIDISGEKPGLFPSRLWKRRARQQAWYPGETLITGIGQGFTLITPLQLAVATATLSRQGQRLQPRVVRSISAPDSAESYPVSGNEGRRVVLRDKKYWQVVIDAMIGVVHGPTGTARRTGFKAPYTIAGKTGTSQVFTIKQDEEYEEQDIPRELRDHGLFIAFAPAHDPQIAVAAVVEHGGGGSSSAAPIVRRLMDEYFKVQTKAADDDSGF